MTVDQRKPRGYWTEETVRAEASKCATKTAFQLACSAGYAKAKRLNILDELFPDAKPYTAWDEEKIRAEARKYTSKVEFYKLCESGYLRACRLKIIDELFDNQRKTWTEAEVRAEAAKYPSKRAFQVGCSGAHSAAYRLNLLNELFVNQRRRWDEASIRIEASKYCGKAEFQRACMTAYDAGRRLGIIDTLGFENRAPSDNDAIYIWRAVGEYFNGNPVYKIGVTSQRLGTRRIKQCAVEAGFEFELICCEAVQGKATDLEKKLHILGDNPGYVGFGGASEFRALSDSALYAAVSLICQSI